MKGQAGRLTADEEAKDSSGLSTKPCSLKVDLSPTFVVADVRRGGSVWECDKDIACRT